jgi:diguanylate cyclase (GGDEF)-like protein
MDTTASQSSARDNSVMIDGLTGLPNRGALVEYLRTAMPEASSRGRNIALCIIDIDRMRSINEEFGVLAGDDAIRMMGERIKNSVQSNDFVARFGGDEFAVVMFYNNFDRVSSEIERILSIGSQPAQIAGVERVSSISVGCSIFPECGDDIEEIIAMADQAAGKALSAGGNCSIYFDKSMRKEQERRKWIENKITVAIDAKKIRPYYQPLINLYDDSIVGFEVLARWFDTDEGQIYPDQFISAAERIGKIGELTDHLIDEVADFALELGENYIFAINLSPLQLTSIESADNIIKRITDKGLPLSKFEFEVTENVLIEDVKTANEVLARLRSKGASIGLDDFGAGYSSLQYIRTLPFDKIKIDRGYVKEMHTHDGSTIVNAVLSLSNALGFTATAEGIEDIETVDLLKALGCGRGQGWYFAKAMPAEDVAPFLVQYAATLAKRRSEELKIAIKPVNMDDLPDVPEEYMQMAS